MKKKFYVPNYDDKRIIYAEKYLIKNGFSRADSSDNADFILLGVNPKKDYLNYKIPVFAGNITKENVYDYAKSEGFKIINAYLTAEGALKTAIENSPKSLISSNILVTGYGRIAKALCRYLFPFTNNITVCARNENDIINAKCNQYNTITFDNLSKCEKYDFIFNTVPHPCFNENEIKSISKEALIIDLASFPGGVDIHFAKAHSLNLIIARGLPAQTSPKSAGIAVGEEIIRLTSEVFT